MKYVKYVVFIFLVQTLCYGNTWKDYFKARKIVSKLNLSSESLCREAGAYKITNKVTFFKLLRLGGVGIKNKDYNLMHICKERFKEVGQRLSKAEKFLKAFEEIFCENGHNLNSCAIKNNYVDILGMLFFLKCLDILNPESERFYSIYETYKMVGMNNL